MVAISRIGQQKLRSRPAGSSVCKEKASGELGLGFCSTSGSVVCTTFFQHDLLRIAPLPSLLLRPSLTISRIGQLLRADLEVELRLVNADFDYARRDPQPLGPVHQRSAPSEQAQRQRRRARPSPVGRWAPRGSGGAGAGTRRGWREVPRAGQAVEMVRTMFSVELSFCRTPFSDFSPASSDILPGWLLSLSPRAVPMACVSFKRRRVPVPWR